MSQSLPSQIQPVIPASSPQKTLPPDPEPILQGLGHASERRLSIRIPLKRLRRLPGNLWAGSRSLALNRKLLFQLLHWEFRKGSRSSDQKGTFIISSFFYHSLLIRKLPCRVPQGIPSASPAKDIQPESESPKVKKPPSPSAGKTLPKMLNPPCSEDTNVPTSAASNPAFPPATYSSHDVVHQPPWPDPALHQDGSRISPKSFGLRVHGGSQQGEGSSIPRPKKQP
jgi:hypothetical protein